MNPEDAFLARILEHPDDDGPRLIYADFLDEAGNPRGTFIRLQCALERMDAGDTRRAEFQEAERTLLQQYRDEWSAPLLGLGSGFEFRRGFVEVANIDARQFLRSVDSLYAVAPIRHLRILDLGSSLHRVAEHPSLDRLSELTIFAQHLGEPLGQALADSPHLGNLRGLHLARNRLSDNGIRKLVTCSKWNVLRNLDLRDNAIGNEGARSLASAPLHQLERLNLGENEIGAGGLAAIFESEQLSALGQLDVHRNLLGGRTESEFVGIESRVRLRELDLSLNGIHAPFLERLAAAAPQPMLADLQLDFNQIGDYGLQILLRSNWAQNLRRLSLRGNQIRHGAELLAGSPQSQSLRELYLQQNPIDHGQLRSLLQSPFLKDLYRLEITCRNISPMLQAALRERFATNTDEMMRV